MSTGRSDGKDPAMRGSGERAFQAAGKISEPPRSPEWPEQTGRMRVQEKGEEVESGGSAKCNEKLVVLNKE